MELFHKKDRPLHYVEWFVTDEESDESWMSYINHHLTGTPGGELPFADSEWSFDYHNEDARIFNLAHKALYEDPDVDSTGIKLTVINGNINLTGTVRKPEDIAKAETIIRRIKEVWAVNNELTVEEKKGNSRSPLFVIS